ncbi:MAG TPA: hypothetical protein VGA03_13505 [Anaerolineales bacterium]
MAADKIKINRAPVMTLWSAVVAEQIGYDPQAALTLGKAVSGLNAQSKGRRLGIYEPASDQEKEAMERARKKMPGEKTTVDLLGRAVPAVYTEDGLRALDKEKPADPRSVQSYLEKKFGEDLPAVREAMLDLARSFSPEELERRAYSLYEKVRPEIPEGQRGWGAAGDLDLEKIRSLGKRPDVGIPGHR